MGRTIVVGGGPIGIFTGIALARRGHEVVLVDRDPGPAPDGSWPRRLGVMQFMHPHAFRPQTYQVLQNNVPELLDALIAAGAEPRQVPDAPPGTLMLACRRWVFERALRQFAAREPGLALCVGHVDKILVEGGVVRGVSIEGARVDADLVISVTGRTSPLGHEFRGQPEGGNCGFGYVSRMFRTRNGEPVTDLAVPTFVEANGYFAGALPQDDGTLSTIIVRPVADAALVGTRENAGYDAACRAIPLLHEWTNPERFEPITDALIGGGLTNTYFIQGPEHGTPPARGLFFLGDAACTTNPAAGRGVSLGLLGACQLLSLLDDTSVDMDDKSRAFDDWAEANLRPWFRDHVEADAESLRRFAGEDIDPDGPISSQLTVAAAEVDQELKFPVALYLGMVATPDTLKPLAPRVRELLRSGWRPPFTGPSAAEVAEAVNRANAVAQPAAV